jgi:hypothetical protein
MPNGEQMDLVLFQLEDVNDAIVANARSKTIRSLQPMMWNDLSRNPISSIFASIRARTSAGSLRKTVSKLA